MGLALQTFALYTTIPLYESVSLFHFWFFLKLVWRGPPPEQYFIPAYQRRTTDIQRASWIAYSHNTSSGEGQVILSLFFGH